MEAGRRQTGDIDANQQSLHGHEVAALPDYEHALVLIKEKGASDAPEYSSEVCKVKGNTRSRR